MLSAGIVCCLFLWVVACLCFFPQEDYPACFRVIKGPVTLQRLRFSLCDPECNVFGTCPGCKDRREQEHVSPGAPAGFPSCCAPWSFPSSWACREHFKADGQALTPSSRALHTTAVSALPQLNVQRVSFASVFPPPKICSC